MDLIDQQKNYARQAIQEVGKHLNVPIEPAATQIQKFMNLTPSDLDNLAQEFGHPQVIKYIQHIARLQELNHG